MKSRHNLLHTWLRLHKRSLALKTWLSPWWTRIKGFFLFFFHFILFIFSSSSSSILLFFSLLLVFSFYTRRRRRRRSFHYHHSILIMELHVVFHRATAQPRRCLYKLIRWENFSPFFPSERKEKTERRRTIILLVEDYKPHAENRASSWKHVPEDLYIYTPTLVAIFSLLLAAAAVVHIHISNIEWDVNEQERPAAAAVDSFIQKSGSSVNKDWLFILFVI